MLTNLIKFLDPSGLCCIATYERLTIIRIISNLLKILFFFAINLIKFKNSNLLFILINLILLKIAKA
ncbi:hypothetical protein, partial [Wolbachia endosymbiont of Drosophila tristis]|nr:hypothetical protein [Wolbachia endosymbiont of Drosophila tristis]MDU8919710.1 hypothetical protein [Wolbachia endosymbiont of Drosophila tristis]